MNAVAVMWAAVMPWANVRRFVPVFHGKRREAGIWDTRTGLYHPRPDYTDIDIASLARWLNERGNDYPTIIKLTDD